MYLEEDEITADKISEVFSNAFMDVQYLEENRFTVKGIEFPFPLHIVVNTDRKTITFSDMNQVNRISEPDLALICNELNKSYSFCRFYAATHNDMVISICEYDMTFDKGINPYHIVANFRRYERIVGLSVREAFLDYLNP